MRFKAALKDPRGLLGALQVCRSIQRECIIRLHPERTRILSNMTVTDGVQVWMGCRSSFLFADMICSSNNEEQSITCEVLDLAQLIHIVKQAEARIRADASAPQVLVRLTKSGKRPLLKVSMDGLPGKPDLCFDVPLRILTDRDIQGMVPPSLEKQRLLVRVPDIVELTTFIDKLKNTAADGVTFSARVLGSAAAPRLSVNEGEEDGVDEGRRRSKRRRDDDDEPEELPHASLVIYAEHFMARISLKYEAVQLMEKPNLHSSTGAEDGEEDGGSDAEGESRPATAQESVDVVTVTVETKKFARFFSAVKDISPDEICMYLVDRKALVLSVYAAGNNTTMVAYIPARI